MFTLLLIISLLGTPGHSVASGSIARASYLRPSGVTLFVYGNSSGEMLTGSRFVFSKGKNLLLSFGIVHRSILVGKLMFDRTYGLISFEYHKNIPGGKIYLNFEHVFPAGNFWKN